MLKAIFLDLDETLCDTTGANTKALVSMGKTFHELFGANYSSQQFTAAYLKGIYRELDERYSALLLPVTDEAQFRLALIKLILNDMGIAESNDYSIEKLQNSFDEARTRCFDFFPGIKDLLIELKQHFTLVVITNGPEFSQVAKVNAVNLEHYVDHIIIGGQEKEQKPALSIFQKALTLSQCKKEEAIHVGDSLSADIQGANNAGITSVWISHGNELPLNKTVIPSHTIENPFQLRDLLVSLAPQLGQSL
jgi:HAD superfamily hydrolase (TIGR01549 family)